MKTKLYRRILPFFAAALLFVPLQGFARNVQIQDSYFYSVVDFISENYRYGVTKTELINAAKKYMAQTGDTTFEAAVTGMTSILDPYSAYLAPEIYQQWNESSEGSYGGIGVGVTLSHSDFFASEIFPDSPAEKAGIQVGDMLWEVDGTLISGKTFDEVTALLKADRPNVSLVVKRFGTAGEQLLKFELTKAPVNSPDLYSHIEDGIGVIVLNSFNEMSYPALQEALKTFDEAKVDKIIFDIRDNPGGTDVVMRMASLFIPTGPVTHLEFINPELNETYTVVNETPGKYQLAVLVNENSASASEMFAGAIQDTDSGTVIGTKTFGKGSMQITQTLRYGGGIKLTVGTYVTPHKNEVNHVGITPDIVVENRVVSYEQHPERTPLEGKKEIGAASTEPEIKAVKERLDLLGYYTGDYQDKSWNGNTVYALKQFQAEMGLPQTGVCDITTQIRLENVCKDKQVVIDDQYAAAKNLLLESKQMKQ